MPRESYATKFARLGGRAKSPAKAAAARRNGALGGRPKTSQKNKVSSDMGVKKQAKNQTIKGTLESQKQGKDGLLHG